MTNEILLKFNLLIQATFPFALILGMLTGCNSSKSLNTNKSFNVKVMSFNIAGDMEEDNDNWQERMVEVGKIIAQEKPDVIGFQESYLGNFKIIQTVAPGYSYYGLNEKGNNDDKDESLRLLFRSDRWQVDSEESGIFWYTRTPEVPGSKDWEALWIRDCVYARFVDLQTKDAFYLFNSHWSYASQLSRDNSARLLAQKIDERKCPDPYFAIGDFNAKKDGTSIQYLLTEEDNPSPMEAIIYHYVDGIFAQADQFKIIEAKVIENDKASDHRPVVANVKVYTP